MKKFIILVSLAMLLLSFILGRFVIPFPTDGLNYLPSFSLDHWERPHNSLLSDPLYQFEPWRIVAKNTILKGKIPFWNVYNNVPLIANPQAQVFYPLTVLYYLLPITVALWLIPLLKCFLYGLFSFLYLRKIKIQANIAIAVSLLLPLSAFFLMWLQWPHTSVFLFLPLILFLIESIRRERKAKSRNMVLIALAVFFMILGGHPGTIIHLLLTINVYAIVFLFKKKSDLLRVLFFEICGLLLASLQLIPFLEYLVHSQAFDLRVLHQNHFFLPKIGFIYNIIPFVLGAPHAYFYKQISSLANFQELNSGYVGMIILLSLTIFSKLVWKNSIFRFWFLFSVLSMLIAYGIWPFSLLVNVPPFSIIANTRLLDFASFGLIIAFGFVLNKMILFRTVFGKIRYIVIFFGLESFLCLVLFLFPRIYEGLNLDNKIQLFLHIFISHTLVVSITTFIFFVAIFFNKKFRGIPITLYLFILLITVFLQTSFLFLSYNTIRPISSYYPKTELINILSKLPQGKIIEIGNPNLPPHINQVYQIYASESDDALNIAKYKQAFRNAFPVQNHWGKVDKINRDGLEKFGIKYLVADYDPNLEPFTIQAKHNALIELSKTPTSIVFKPKFRNMAAIRVITANYNRLNSCIIHVELSSKSSFSKKQIPCEKVRDNMFYTIPMQEQMHAGIDYKLSFYLTDSNINNSVGLWGGSNLPYVEIFSGQNSLKIFSKIWHKDNVGLWEYSNAHFIYPTNSKVLYKTDSEYILQISNSQQVNFEIKIPLYPGWNAQLDGQKIELKKNNLFVAFTLPAGEHIVRIYYQPYSFYVGIVVTCVVFLLITVYYIRVNTQNMFKLQYIPKKFSLQFTFNKLFFSFLLCSAIATIFTVVLIVLSPSLKNQQFLTTINWLSIHHHVLANDYKRFFILGLLFPLVNVSLFLYYLWRRKK